MRRTKRYKWESESAMCEAFIAQYVAAGWAAYPETFDFDFVLVSPEGVRIGVEAKLQVTVGVLYQAGSRIGQQVHFRAVLVPVHDPDFVEVARKLKLHVFNMASPQSKLFYDCFGRLEATDRPPAESLRWSKEVTGQLLSLNIPSLRPGSPAPRKITKWKLHAVKFCLSHTDKTFSAKEFATAAAVDMKRWVGYGWIEQVGKETRNGRLVATYRLTEHHDRPDLQYPELAAALRDSTTA